jgi:hypothetical protein
LKQSLHAGKEIAFTPSAGNKALRIYGKAGRTAVWEDAMHGERARHAAKR